MLCSVQRSCGGCPTLRLSRSDEHQRKADRVIDALEGEGLRCSVPLPIAGENRQAYRNRLRMQVVDGRATLFNRAKSNGCPALRPELWVAIAELVDKTSHDRTLLSGTTHLEVRVGDETGIFGLSLACSHPGDHQIGPLEDVLGCRWRVSCKASTVQQSLKYGISSDLTVEVPLSAFVQINSDVNRLLVFHVSSEVKRIGASSFIDLFAGAGNLSLPLLDAGLVGHAIERHAAAVATLSARRGTSNLTVVQGDVASRLDGVRSADVVLVNPPRSGIKIGHERIFALADDAIVIVGCDPRSLASDMARFVSLGLRIDNLATFDMFPGTDHVETVATLVR